MLLEHDGAVGPARAGTIATGELLRGGEQVAVHQVELGAWGFAVLGRFLVCRAQGRVAELPP